jgi:hypothetical protein
MRGTESCRITRRVEPLTDVPELSVMLTSSSLGSARPPQRDESTVVNKSTPCQYFATRLLYKKPLLVLAKGCTYLSLDHSIVPAFHLC